ncbi:MAG: iron-sulfur cluster assembly protein [Bacteroidota bacterium]
MEEKIFNSFEILVLRDQIIEQIKTCYDPEIPVNIYDLGLIYEINIEQNGDVLIKMTLTSAMCPAAQSIPPEIKQKVEIIPELKNVRVEIVWEPRWETAMMSDEARLSLGM